MVLPIVGFAFIICVLMIMVAGINSVFHNNGRIEDGHAALLIIGALGSIIMLIAMGAGSLKSCPKDMVPYSYRVNGHDYVYSVCLTNDQVFELEKGRAK